MSTDGNLDVNRVDVQDIQKFQGGQGAMTKAAGVGVLGLAATLGLLFGNRQATLFAYLIAFSYWVGIAFAALLLLQMFHAFRAKWMVVLRRPVEVMAVALPIFALLFIPIVAGMEYLYSWVNPSPSMGKEALDLLARKHPFLNVGGFVIRAYGYLLIAGLVAQRLFGLSTRQDQSGATGLTLSQRKFGVGALPFVSLVITFAAFDWLMTLNPLWFSTIFGVYYFAGSILAAIAVLILVSNRAQGRDLFGRYMTPEHTHNLGKLLLAFVCFWGYIGFSQFLLIWIANLPEEIPFYMVRMRGPWAYVGIFLIIGHFVIPFGALLSRDRKRSPKRLARVAAWVLFIHFVDLYWLVMPTLTPDGPSFSPALVTAFFGVGGIAVAFAIWRARGHYTVPIKDPYLAVSLRYKQP